MKTAAESSDASTPKWLSVPSFLIAAMPAGIESWRKPVVLEKTSTRNRSPPWSGPNTLTATVRVVSSSPSDTVTFAVYVPAAV